MLIELESQILAQIDNIAADANSSDDALFASGYLSGHLTLAVAQLLADQRNSADALYRQVMDNLQAAFRCGELSPRDSAVVTAMWAQFFTQAR